MKITFEEKTDDIYSLDELETGTIFMKYNENSNDVFMKMDKGVVRLNDGHEMHFVNGMRAFSKVDAELIVERDFDNV
nr:MAG TPA: hypothetical protein [Caudoviricetes sp.]